MRNRLWSVVAVLSLMVVFSPGTLAGGWAVVDISEPPTQAVAGEVVTISYRVLAHGNPDTAVPGIESTIMLTHRETGKVVKANGTATRDPWVYAAEFTLDQSGEWKWMVLAYKYLPDAPVITAMPTLTVLPAGSRAGADDQAGTPASSSAAVSDVIIDDDGFTPARIEIPAGTDVTWRNNGTMPHQVMSGDLAFSDSGMLAVDESFTQAFDTPGTYVYSCGPHPWMTGAIVVT